MARKAADKQALSFLIKKEDSGKTVLVNAKISAELNQSVKTAQAVAEKHGYEMSISAIVRAALRDAVKQVREQFPDDFQGDLNLDDEDKTE